MGMVNGTGVERSSDLTAMTTYLFAAELLDSFQVGRR